VRGSQFRPPPPGNGSNYNQVLTSSAYTDQFDEVRRLGYRFSTERTADQTQAAFFWANDVDGTYKPPGQLFSHTQTIAADQNVSPESKVKLFAQVAIVMADAAILAWDAKFNTPVDLWRPVTGIQQGDTDANPNTPDVDSWVPLATVTPNFPAYVSGHATQSLTVVLDRTPCPPTGIVGECWTYPPGRIPVFATSIAPCVIGTTALSTWSAPGTD
jgi:hypothetical protein